MSGGFPHRGAIRSSISASFSRRLAPRVDYRHISKLCGRRPEKPDSKNTAWKNASFRGYADYMETEDFVEGIEELAEFTGSRRTAIMCAEAVWWRCHRSMISDYLKSKGIEVIHILSE